MVPLICRRSITGVALCAALSLAAHARAQSRGVVFGEATGGKDRSASLGLGLALPGSSLGRGWAVRASAATGRYDYQSGGQTIDGRYKGGELLLLRQTSGADGYFNVGAGPRFMDTKLSPNDPGSRRQGEHWDLGVALDGGRSRGPWRMQGYGAYGFRLRDYYARADLTRRIGTSPFRLGVEIGAEGDRDYERQRIGVVATAAPRTNWELRLALGARNGGESKGGYGAVSVVRTF